MRELLERFAKEATIVWQRDDLCEKWRTIRLEASDIGTAVDNWRDALADAE
jgi:hypothetical protein